MVAKASRNEMRSASVPYVHASLIQRIYPFTREKIPSFVDELALVVLEYCEGFPYKSTKMEGIFFIDYGSSAFILRFDLAQTVFCSTLQALERELLGV